ncbi:MAG: phage major capsid protein [Rhizobiaceae bacterium]|nr:phage major capsid protein [Rhizobiaceae bacterium]MCV0406331.1 phage major capsid protein [Rhizobiaceae bacterium]
MTKHVEPRKLRGIVAVRADVSGDPKALVGEIKSAFEQFKEANDQRIKALESGKADVVLDEKVETINAHITDLQSQLAEIATKAASRGLNGGGEDETAKAAAKFGREVGAEVSVEDFQAYRDGLNVYMRRGGATPSNVMAAMSVGSDPDGGYTVTPAMSDRIVKRVYETSPMRQLATVETIGTDKMEGFNDLGEGEAGWVGEKASRPETNTPQLGKWEIPVHEMYAMPKTTQKLLDDSAWDIEGWLANKTADKFSRTENAAFVNGDGVLKPKGLWAYPTAATADATRAWGTFEHLNTGTNGGFGAAPAGSDKLIDLVYKLKAAYRQNANWLMARATLAEVRKLKDGDGNYLWQPNFEARQGGLLLGQPIVEGEDVEAIANGSKSIAFGDFREAYTIVDRIGIRVLRDPYTQKGFVLFYTTRRVGGGAVNFEAVKFLRFSS